MTTNFFAVFTFTVPVGIGTTPDRSNDSINSPVSPTILLCWSRSIRRGRGVRGVRPPPTFIMNVIRRQMKHCLTAPQFTVLLIWLIFGSQCSAFSANYRPLQQHISTVSSCKTRCRHQANTLTMGMEVKIRMVGRKSGGEKWLESAYSTYDTRLRSSSLSVTTQYHKNDDELIRNCESDEKKNHKVILLDPLGKLCTSEIFSENMYRWLEEGGSRLTFVIGGADGLPDDLKEGRQKLSLGMLTFTHQFARLLLMEQIYRASEIRKGSGYHK